MMAFECRCMMKNFSIPFRLSLLFWKFVPTKGQELGIGFLLAVFLLGLFGLTGITYAESPSSVGEFEGKPLHLEKFEFVNLSDEYKDIVISTLTNLGETFKADLLKQTFRNLYELGYFEDIKVDAELVDGKVILTFYFTSFPSITHVVISGNSELKRDEILEVMNLAPDRLFNNVYIEQDIAAIIDLYRKSGMIGTKVNIRTRTHENEKIIVYIDIHEGEYIYVERIDIIGCNYLSPRQIKQAMETKERKFYKSDTILKREELTLDVGRIEDYCHSQGFIECVVHEPIVSIDKVDKTDNSPDSIKAYFIVIEIEENDQYRLGSITVHGNEIFKDDQILEQFRQEPGEVFNAVEFKEDINRITELYKSRGYVNAKLSPFQQKDFAQKIVNYEIDIYESSKVHIEHIYIRRNDKTKTYVIDRELKIREGMPLDSYRILLTNQRLLNLQYFSNVWFEYNPSDEEGLVDLVLNVAETRTGMFTLGAGFGTQQGFTVFADIKEINLLGNGIGVGSRVEFGQRNQSIQLYGETQWVRYTPLYLRASLGLDRYEISVPSKELEDNLYLSDDLKNADSNADGSINSNDRIDINGDGVVNADDYATIGSDFPIDSLSNLNYLTKGFNVSFASGYLFFDYIKLVGRIRSYVFNTDNLRDPNIILDDDRQSQLLKDGSILQNDLNSGWQLQNSLLTMLEWNYRDNDFNSTKGAQASIEFEYTGGFLFGNKNHLRNKLDFSWYWSPFRFNNERRDPVFTLVLHGSTETLFPQFNDRNNRIDLEEIRYGELLFFDGLNELRGWRTFSTGSELLGYNKLSLGSELRFPVPGIQQIIWGVLFFDAGTMSYNPNGGFRNLPFFNKGFLQTELYQPYSGRGLGEYETYTRLGKEYRVGLKYAWGFGLRIQIPLLPIRLYFAQKGRQLYDPIEGKSMMHFDSGFETVLSVYGLY